MRKGIKVLLAVLFAVSVCLFATMCDDAQGHTHTASGDWQSDATQHWKVCADDNEKVDEANHTFGDWTIDEEATCTKKGSKSRECSVCGYKVTEDIPSVEHSLGEWKTEKAATCTEKGSKYRECSVCGYKITEDLPAIGHDYEYTDKGDGTHDGVCKNDPSHVINGEHVLGKTYAGHDANKHRKECTVCGANVESEHSFALKGDEYSCECGETIAVTDRDLYKVNSENESERRTFEIDLKVVDTSVLTENQEIGVENYTVNLGSEYNGELLSVKLGRYELEDATLSDGVLTLTKDTFTPDDTGDQTIICVIKLDGGVYKVSVHVTVATRVISGVEEWNTILRDPISSKDADKSGIYGYFTIAGDIDFEHKALRDPAFPEGADTTSLAKKSNHVDGKIGLVGTFDGRGYTLKNFNTENPFGLFLIVSDKNVVKTTIKNLVVDKVWHDNGVIRANIFGHSIANVTFDNITINVEKTSLTGELVSPNAGTLNGRGFICGAYANRNTYRNLTVNASGSTISSLFGWWIKRSGAADDNGAIITCENVVVNAREITYWGRLDGDGDPAMTPTGYQMTGLTYNKDQINEIEVTNEGKRFVIDLKVADTTKALNEQVVGAADDVTIALGDDYGTLNHVKYNGDIIEGATVAGNVLTIPMAAFGAGAIGEREIEVEMLKDGAVNILSVKVLVVTKAIASAAEFVANISDKTATYGYFVLANDIDFNNTALDLPSWYAPTSSAAANDNTIYNGVFFAGTFDGMGYKIKNYNTGSASDGGRYGLFGKIKNATVKNVVIEDVVYTGDEYVGIFAFMAESAKFENITINVKSVTAPSKDITKGQYGFILGRKMQSTSFKDVTVNAEGQEIYSLFAYWIMRDPKTGVKDGNYVTCDNVVVNAKKVHYWGRIDSEQIGDAAKEAPMDAENYPINGLTINVVDTEA